VRIGLVRMRFTPYGGAETFLGRFMKELRGRGHSIDLFTTGWEETAGVTVHTVKARGPSFMRPRNFAAGVCAAVDKAAPEVVISLERTYSQDIYRAGDGCHAEWLARRGLYVSGLKRSLIAANPLHMTLLDLEHKLFESERLKTVAANSEMVKADIIRHYGLPEEKICVIYNGVDTRAFAPSGPAGRRRARESLGVSPGATLLLFVGSGFERKGLACLVRAMGLLKGEADLRLAVVGKGRASAYAREASRLGVGGRVEFAGPVGDVREWYRAADVFVLPSLYEPFSNACLEAMASGLPVVTSSANGAAEIMTGALSGSVCSNPADPGELAGKIGLLLDADARAAAGALARETALEYTIERTVNAFLDLIEGLDLTKTGDGP